MLLAQEATTEGKRMEKDVQTIPLRIYQSETHLMVAAPMPGVEPTDIGITIEGDRLIIRGEERGVGQDRRDVLLNEWRRIGPYYRDAVLPQAVNGSLANATYAEIRLQEINSTRGEWVGHEGSEIRPADHAASGG
jgi:HSP20 family molecular chaperone IbpA